MRAKLHFIISGIIILFFSLGSNFAYSQTAPCGPGPHWIDNCPGGIDFLTTTALVGLNLSPGNCNSVPEQLLSLSGPIEVLRSGPLDISVGDPNCNATTDGHADVVQTEIVSMQLSGGGYELTAGTAFGLPPTLGHTVETPGNPELACSFFDVFFCITVGGNALLNQTPLRLQADLSQIPPTASFVNPDNICIPLFLDGVGPPIVNIVGVEHSVQPPPPPPLNNRGMTDILCTPGSGPGLWDITAEWVVESNSASVPLNMDTDVELYIGGSLYQTYFTPAALTTSNVACLGTFPPCSGLGCGTWDFGLFSLNGTCLKSSVSLGGVDFCICACVVLTIAEDVPVAPGDEIMVILRPASGSVPEEALEDDVMIKVQEPPPTNNRAMTDIVCTPGSGPGLFDISAEWVVESNSGTPGLNMDTEVEILVNGSLVVPVIDQQATLLSPNTVCLGTTPPCSEEDCGTWNFGLFTLDGTCLESIASVVGLEFCTCACAVFSLAPDVALEPGDEIMVLLRPAPGAVPEEYEADDVMIKAFGPNVPTLGEWGLILLTLLLLTLASVAIVQRSGSAQFAMRQGNVPLQSSKKFDAKLYKRIFIRSLLFTPVVLFGLYLGFGEILLADLFGTICSLAIVSYLIHFLKLNSDRN